MKRLTVLAAALAAGLTTVAAQAQESPVDGAAAFAVAPVAEKPAPPASAPALTPVEVSDRGGFGLFSAPAEAQDAAGDIDEITTASVTKKEAAEDQPKKAAKVEEPQKAASVAEVKKEAAASKQAEADKTLAAPTPEKRPELVATARKASVLAKPGEASTAGDKNLIAETKKSAEKKVAALGSGGKYQEIVAKYASAYGVPVTLAHAVISIESNYRAGATGRAGEIGLMQIKPSTARMMGYTGSAKGLYSPENNIKYGMKYLGKARELGGGTTCGTILKYNAGHGAKRMNPVSSAYCSKVKRHLGSV